MKPTKTTFKKSFLYEVKAGLTKKVEMRRRIRKGEKVSVVAKELGISLAQPL